jgi:DNA-binding HxlR family transcriptional regulator
MGFKTIEYDNSKTICPLDYAFKRIGGKFKGRIIIHIHHHNNLLRYSELLKVIAGITPKMLIQALRELEEDGLIVRTVYAVVPPKVEYSLTNSGEDLVPFILYLADWGKEQLNSK